MGVQFDKDCISLVQDATLSSKKNRFWETATDATGMACKRPKGLAQSCPADVYRIGERTGYCSGCKEETDVVGEGLVMVEQSRRVGAGGMKMEPGVLGGNRLEFLD